MPPDQTNLSPFSNPQTMVLEASLPDGSKKKIIIPIFIIVLVLLLLATFLIFTKKISLPFSKSSTFTADRSIQLPESQSTPQIDYAKSLQKTIQVTFTPTQQQEITQYVTIGTTSSDSNLAYKNLVQAYFKMNDIYKQDQDPKIIQAMIELKDYSKIFDQYSDSDMVIPV